MDGTTNMVKENQPLPTDVPSPPPGQRAESTTRDDVHFQGATFDRDRDQLDWLENQRPPTRMNRLGRFLLATAVWLVTGGLIALVAWRYHAHR